MGSQNLKEGPVVMRKEYDWSKCLGQGGNSHSLHDCIAWFCSLDHKPQP